MQRPSTDGPQAQVDSTMVDSSDCEYEYEYDELETDTFYLNLDLTSSSGPIRPPRKRSTYPHNTNISTPIGPTVSVGETDDQPPLPIDPELDSQNKVQIVDLHTRNPLVSYYNQIFSCSWADLVGTELIFSRPQEHSSDNPPLYRHDDFDVVSANPSKIVGQKANLISSSGPGGNQDRINQNEQQQSATPVKSATSNQSRFLDRLAEIKKAKGETDTVRTIFPQKRNQNIDDRLRGWARTEAAVAEVEQLNKQVVQDDDDDDDNDNDDEDGPGQFRTD